MDFKADYLEKRIIHYTWYRPFKDVGIGMNHTWAKGVYLLLNLKENGKEFQKSREKSKGVKKKKG